MRCQSLADLEHPEVEASKWQGERETRQVLQKDERKKYSGNRRRVVVYLIGLVITLLLSAADSLVKRLL